MTFLSPKLYQQITESVPIVCVDVLPIRQLEDRWQIGVITRGTGQEAGKLAILGGRVQHNELIPDAIRRHIRDGWNLEDYRFAANNQVSQPFYVQQYLHRAEAEAPLGYDPTKHSIGLNYLIELVAEPQPHDEARDFKWLYDSELPTTSAFNQHLIMKIAFDVLNTTSV